jgi:hypothetical protein
MYNSFPGHADPPRVDVQPAPNTEVLEDPDFSLTGFQVVRSEFFYHLQEPSVSFSDCKITFNTACLRKLPTVEYVQFLINPETKSLAARPCHEDDKDAFMWCTNKDGKRKPRSITGRLFFAKLVSLMKWNPDYRYKLLGKVIRQGDEFLILFDLKATEIYQRIYRPGEKPRTSRKPVFPAEWQNQFGLPVEEHKKQLQVNIFDGYTIFHVQETAKETEEASV